MKKLLFLLVLTGVVRAQGPTPATTLYTRGLLRTTNSTEAKAYLEVSSGGGTNVSGNGTANRVVKWTGTNTIGNAIAVDDGSSVDFVGALSGVRLPDGSVASSGLSFSIDTNIGLARINDNVFTILSHGIGADFGSGNFGSYKGLKTYSLRATNDVTLLSGAGLGKVLTSDANGVGSWQTPGGSAGTTNIFDTTIITNNFFVSGKGNTLIVTQTLSVAGGYVY